MAKKRISSADLGWLISEQVFDSGSRAARITLAVVPEDELGWRVIVSRRVERALTEEKSNDLPTWYRSSAI